MEGKLIKTKLNNYITQLGKKEVVIPDDLINEFAENVRERFLSKDEERGPTLRMSNLGKPLCQLQKDYENAERTGIHPHLAPVRFAVGDMLEQWLFMVMKAAGIKIQTELPCELELSGQLIKGTADVLIHDKVWDVKAVSKFSFKKYGPEGGFEALYKDDPFGYVVQLMLYSKSLDKEPGGWIVINKDNGDIEVCEVPLSYQKYQDEAIQIAEEKVRAIIEKKPFKRCFEDEEETYYKKPTGNRKLCFNCQWCDYKNSCWPDLIYHPAAMSKAMDPKYEWYTELNNVVEK